MPAFAWKWNSVKDSQPMLLLVVNVTPGLIKLTMREYPYIVDIFLKQVILHPIVPKGPGISKIIRNPLGGLDLMMAIN
jgi:hypothetical protein